VYIKKLTAAAEIQGLPEYSLAARQTRRLLWLRLTQHAAKIKKVLNVSPAKLEINWPDNALFS
jgi:hypothetical protein